jgi:hypothetical protein
MLAYLLKARTVESEKHPLLANDSETTFVSKQRNIGKATEERCFLRDPCRNVISKEQG